MGLCGNIIIDYCELVIAASCGHRRQHVRTPLPPLGFEWHLINTT